MYGTFTLFNFYQQPNTGIFRDPKTVDQLTNPSSFNYKSGEVADFNWFFPYASTLTPNQFIQNFGKPGINFRYDLLTDSVYSGTRFPSVQISSSGYLYKDSNKSSFLIGFSGSTSPKASEFSSGSINISGSVKNSQPDIFSYKEIISGLFNSGNKDICLNKNVFSGYFYKNEPKTIQQINISGSFNPGYFDNFYFNSVFSGRFFPGFNDDSSISYNFYSFSVGQNNINVVTESISDEVSSITYQFSSYSVSNI